MDSHGFPIPKHHSRGEGHQQDRGRAAARGMDRDRTVARIVELLQEVTENYIFRKIVFVIKKTKLLVHLRWKIQTIIGKENPKQSSC